MMRFVCFFILFFQSLSAVFVGNPASPALLMRGIFSSDESIVRLKTEAVFDRITRRSLKEEGHIFALQSSAGYGGLLLNVWERFEAYLYGGAGDFKIRSVGRFQGFTWQGGGRVVLIPIKESLISFDVKYWMATPFSHDHAKGWQVAGGITQQIGFFYPYLGFIVSRLDCRLKGRDFKENHSSSILFGASFTSGKYLYATFEGRVVHEKAFSALLGLMF
jgi:hypothetical protein